MDSWTRQTPKKASADREKRLGKTEKLLQLSEKSYRSFCNSSGKGQPGGAYPYLLRSSRGQALMIFRRSFFRK